MVAVIFLNSLALLLLSVGDSDALVNPVRTQRGLQQQQQQLHFHSQKQQRHQQQQQPIQLSSFRLQATAFNDTETITKPEAGTAAKAATTTTDKDKMDNNDKKSEEEESLSDLDARVLREMLQDNDKLDLEAEENMKKLLERGTAPRSVTVPTPKKPTDEENNSDFSSQVFRKLSDNSFWKNFQRQTEDFLESAKLLVANRLERDGAIVASLGAFIWERAVRDVARGLPAAATLSKKAVVFAIAAAKNETTPDTMDSQTKATLALPLFEENPIDELKSVGTSLKDIIVNQASTTTSTNTFDAGMAAQYLKQRQQQKNSRQLKTVAPAGSINNSERLQRAFERKKKEREDDRDVTKVANKAVGKVVDMSYELQRDLQAEPNRPGYKAKKVGKAIAGSKAGRALSAVKESLQLGAAAKNVKNVALPFGGANKNVVKEEQPVIDTNSQELKKQQKPMKYVDVDALPRQQPPMDYVDVEAQPTQSEEREQEILQQQQQPKQSATTAATAVSAEAHTQPKDETSKNRMPKPPSYTPTPAQVRAMEQYEVDKQLVMGYRSEILEKLKVERIELANRLEVCIENPEETWLRPEYINIEDNHASFSEQGLRGLVKAMIQCRDEIEDVINDANANKATETFEDVMKQLREIKSKLEKLQREANHSVSASSADALSFHVYDGTNGGYDSSSSSTASSRPIMFELDDVEKRAKLPQMPDMTSLPINGGAAANINGAAATKMTAETSTPPKSSFEAFVSSSQQRSVQTQDYAGGAPPSPSFSSSSYSYSDSSSTSTSTSYDVDIEEPEPEEDLYRAVAADVIEVVPEPVIVNVEVEKNNNFATTTANVANNGAAVSQPNNNGHVTVQDATFTTTTTVSSSSAYSYDEESFRSVSANAVEIVSDDDFLNAVGEAKTVKQLSDEEYDNENKEGDSEAEKNVAVDLLLRSLDVSLFLVEKGLEAVPIAVETTQTAAKRVDEVKRGGRGSRGWKRIGNARRGSNRY